MLATKMSREVSNRPSYGLQSEQALASSTHNPSNTGSGDYPIIEEAIRVGGSDHRPIFQAVVRFNGRTFRCTPGDSKSRAIANAQSLLNRLRPDVVTDESKELEEAIKGMSSMGITVKKQPQSVISPPRPTAPSLFDWSPFQSSSAVQSHSTQPTAAATSVIKDVSTALEIFRDKKRDSSGRACYYAKCPACFTFNCLYPRSLSFVADCDSCATQFKVDLTRYGIEPNPGPGSAQATALFNKLVSTFGQTAVVNSLRQPVVFGVGATGDLCTIINRKNNKVVYYSDHVQTNLVITAMEFKKIVDTGFHPTGIVKLNDITAFFAACSVGFDPLAFSSESENDNCLNDSFSSVIIEQYSHTPPTTPSPQPDPPTDLTEQGIEPNPGPKKMKQELQCRFFKQTGSCRDGDACAFYHGGSVQRNSSQKLGGQGTGQNSKGSSDKREGGKSIMHECLASKVISKRFGDEYNTVLRDVADLKKKLADPPEPPPVEPPDEDYQTFQRLTDTSTILYNNENRKFRPILDRYYVEVATFSGIKIGGVTGADFVQEKLGWYVRDRFRIVTLPTTIVDELSRDLFFREHTWEVFLALVTRCRTLVSVCDIPSDVERDTVLYAPVIAFMRWWLEMQQCSALIQNKGIRPRRWATAACVAGAAVGLLAHSVVVPILCVGALICVGLVKSSVLPEYEATLPFITTGDHMARTPPVSWSWLRKAWGALSHYNPFDPKVPTSIENLSNSTLRDPRAKSYDYLPGGPLGDDACLQNYRLMGGCIPVKLLMPTQPIVSSPVILPPVQPPVVDEQAPVVLPMNQLVEPSVVEFGRVKPLVDVKIEAVDGGCVVRTRILKGPKQPVEIKEREEKTRDFQVYYKHLAIGVSVDSTCTFEQLLRDIKPLTKDCNIAMVGGRFCHKDELVCDLPVGQRGIRVSCVNQSEVDLSAYGLDYTPEDGPVVLGISYASPKRDLTVCGDVEKNPGPVLTMFRVGEHSWWPKNHVVLPNKWDVGSVGAEFGVGYPPKISPVSPPNQQDDSYVVDRKWWGADHENLTPSQRKFGFGSGPFRPVYYNSCRENELATIKGRVTSSKTDPEPVFMRRFCKWFKCNFHLLFPNLHTVHAMKPRDYIEKSNATPSMKARLLAALVELEEDGIDCDTVLSPQQLKKWSKAKAFVKTENMLQSGLCGEKERPPRNISGCDEHATILQAPTIIGLQQQVKEIWGVSFPLIFSSGIPADALATRIARFPGLIAEDDVEGFDGSVSRPLLDLEVWMLKKLHAGRAVIDLTRAMIPTRGLTAHGVKYGGVVSRRSGVSGTSLFNTIWNICMHLFIFIVEREISTRLALTLVLIVGCGDDDIMVHDGAPINFKAYMIKLGFVSKAIYRVALQFAEYCSNRFYPTSSGWTMAPKFGRVIAKLGYFISPPNNINPLAIVRGCALGLWNACYCVPPLRAYLRRLLELTQGYAPYFGKLEEWKMVYTKHETTSGTWAALMDVYDWDTGRQKMFEESLSKLKLGDDLVSPLALLAMDRDTQGVSWCYDKDSLWGSYSCFGNVSSRLWTQDWERPRDLTRYGVEPNPGPDSVHICWFVILGLLYVCAIWAISNKERNKLQHSLNGNMSSKEAKKIGSNKKKVRITSILKDVSRSRSRTPSRSRSRSRSRSSSRVGKPKKQGKGNKNKNKDKDLYKVNFTNDMQTRASGPKKTHRERFGVDFLGEVQYVNATAGTVLASRSLNLKSFGPWTRKLGSLYTEMRVHSMSVTYKSNLPTNIGGSLALCIVSDPDVALDNTPGGVPLIQAVLGQSGCKTGRAFDTITARRPSCKKTNDVLVATVSGESTRWSDFGKVYLITTTACNPIGSGNSYDYGMLEIHYDVEFSIPTSFNDDSTEINVAAVPITPVTASTLGTTFGVLSDFVMGATSGIKYLYADAEEDKYAFHNPTAGIGSTTKGIALKPGAYELNVDVITDTTQTASGLTFNYDTQSVLGDWNIGLNPTRAPGTFTGVTNTNFGQQASTTVFVPEDAGATATYITPYSVSTVETGNASAGSGFGWLDVLVSTANIAGKILGIFASIRKLSSSGTRGKDALRISRSNYITKIITAKPEHFGLPPKEVAMSRQQGTGVQIVSQAARADGSGDESKTDGGWSMPSSPTHNLEQRIEETQQLLRELMTLKAKPP